MADGRSGLRGAEPRRAARAALRTGIAVLVLLAIWAALLRTLILFGAIAPLDEPGFVREYVGAFNRSTGVPIEETIALDAKFGRWPVTSVLHVVPALLFMLLAPLQFSRGIRARHPWFHRWSGRLLILAAFFFGITGLVLGLVEPYGGGAESVAIGSVGALLLAALAKAYLAIRRGDVERHRRWMIRVFAIALGVAVVRIVSIPLAYALGPSHPRGAFALSVWLGFALSLIGSEIILRFGRRTPERRVAAPEVRLAEA